ncbi:MAG: hypothetical protein SVO01_02745 [Thermotogota bacterium]|nr:hypothetical protein [Thermotogota bacterium]
MLEEPTKNYKSPRRKLVKFFETSRDKWKEKCLDAKYQIKLLKSKIRNLENSKAKYKNRAKEYEAKLKKLEKQARKMEQEMQEIKKNCNSGNE